MNGSVTQNEALDKGRCWYVLAGISTYLRFQQRTDVTLVICSNVVVMYEKKGNAGITLEKVDGCCKKECEFNAVLKRSLNEKSAFDKKGGLCRKCSKLAKNLSALMHAARAMLDRTRNGRQYRCLKLSQW